MQKAVLIGMLVGTVLFLAACAGAGSVSQAQTVSVEVKEFAFTPGNLEVKAGQPVKLTLQNAGTLEHDFSILEIPVEGEPKVTGGAQHDMGDMAHTPELHVAAMNGQSAMLEFTPTKPGTYEYFCTVSGHKAAGMSGTLVVTAP